MAARHSAGLLPFRTVPGALEVFLIHMGGPYWGHKDEGAWSVAKGEYDPGSEDARDAAAREFCEEVGRPAPRGELMDLGSVRLPSGKVVRTFAVDTREDLSFVSSNLFTMEWPPHSGRQQEFPEADSAAWLPLDSAHQKIISSQRPILSALVTALGGSHVTG